jgi:hypothetical protein
MEIEAARYRHGSLPPPKLHAKDDDSNASITASKIHFFIFGSFFPDTRIGETATELP